MFCKWCGKKISNNGVPCPSCGKNQDPLESGNGFWDLCTTKPEPQRGISEVMGTLGRGADDKSKEHTDKAHCKQERKTQSKFLSQVLPIVTFSLLVIAMVMVSIGMAEVGECLSELGSVRSGIANLKSLVDIGFDDIAQYYSTIPKPEPTEPLENELDENDEVITIDERIENGDVMLIKASQICINHYEVISEADLEATNHLYLASGDILTEANVKIYWQKSLDGGNTWETISETVPYIVVSNAEEALYRILCLVGSNATNKEICCYATTDEPDSSEVSNSEDRLLNEIYVPPTGTTPAQDESALDNMTPEQQDDDLDSIISVGSNEGMIG